MADTPLYTSPCAARSLWHEYRVYDDRVELDTLTGVKADLLLGSFGCLVIASLSCRTILPAHAGVTNRASRAHTSGASTSSSD
jgi:hypothetical protein